MGANASKFDTFSALYSKVKNDPNLHRVILSLTRITSKTCKCNNK